MCGKLSYEVEGLEDRRWLTEGEWSEFEGDWLKVGRPGRWVVVGQPALPAEREGLGSCLLNFRIRVQTDEFNGIDVIHLLSPLVHACLAAS